MSGNTDGGQEARDEVERPFGIRSFGDYLLLDKLGAGAMGAVYGARQISTNRAVALKLVSLGAGLHPKVLARFRTEVEAAASLDHPNIVPVYTAGEYQNQLFLTMKLVSGQSLAEWLKTRSRPASLAQYPLLVKWMVQICRAIHHAHERGVLHRDLKPGNILLDEQEIPYVADFGIAKLLDQSHSQTLTEEFLGTPAYMSPEQASGNSRAVTSASDIYALGAVLYELIAGMPPFAGPDRNHLFRRIQEEEPRSPSRLSREEDSLKLAYPGLPSPVGDLDTICLKCLQKDPTRRYASAALLADDLDHWLRGEPISARAVTEGERIWRWIRRHPVTAGLTAGVVFAVLLGLVGTTWQWQIAEGQRREAEAGRTRLQLQIAEDHLSSGNSSLALAEWALLVRDQPRERVAAERLLNILNQRIFLVPGLVSNGSGTWQPLTVTRHQNSRVEITNNIDLVLRKSGVEAHRTTLTKAHEQVIRSVRFSPDGNLLVTASGDQTAKVWDLATRSVVSVLRHAGGVHYAEFSPDGRHVVTASRDRTARLWEMRTGQPVGEPMRHADSVNFASFSPDGAWVVTVADDRTMRIWDGRTGSHYSEPVSLAEPAAAAQFGPEGRTVRVFFDEEGRNTRIFVLTQRARVVEAPGTLTTNWAPNFPEVLRSGHREAVTFFDRSPDGRLLVTASKDQQARLWRSDTLQPSAPPLVHPARVNCARFSGDGRRVVTSTAAVDGISRIRVWDSQTGYPLSDWMESNEPVRNVGFSEDNTWVRDSAGFHRRIRIVAESPPTWLPDLAEAVGGLRITPAQGQEVVEPRRLDELWQKLAKLREANLLPEWILDHFSNVP